MRDIISTLIKHIRTFHSEIEKKDFTGSLLTSNRICVLSFVNAHALNTAFNDSIFFESLIQSDFLLRDGFGMEILLKLSGKDPGLNMNGTDFIPEILQSFKGRKILLCGTDLVYLEKAEQKLKRLGLNSVGFLDGFQNEERYFNEINRLKPDIVLFGMGMPKQEILSAQLKERLSFQCLFINGGAIIDFLANRFSRAPSFIRKLRCEWLYRLFKEPTRLWKRYLIGNINFLLRVGAFKLGLLR